MNAKISVFAISVEAIIYLLLYNLHDDTFKNIDHSITSLNTKVYLMVKLDLVYKQPFPFYFIEISFQQPFSFTHCFLRFRFFEVFSKATLATRRFSQKQKIAFSHALSTFFPQCCCLNKFQVLLDTYKHRHTQTLSVFTIFVSVSKSRSMYVVSM